MNDIQAPGERTLQALEYCKGWLFVNRAVVSMRIPEKLTIDSASNCPSIPAETDQRIGAKRRWFYSATGRGQSGSTKDFIFRMDSPLRLSW